MSSAARISMRVWWPTPSTTRIRGSGRCLSGRASGPSDAWRTARPHPPTVTDRRPVVVTDEVFYTIDAALPPAPRRGVPSRAQFIGADLLDALERFATSWDELPRLIVGRDDYRVLISRGRLVYAFVVDGQLADDGTIELVSIELDVTGPAANGPGPLDQALRVGRRRRVRGRCGGLAGALGRLSTPNGQGSAPHAAAGAARIDGGH